MRIEIEFGQNLLAAVKDVSSKAESGYVGEMIREAFGIHVTTIVEAVMQKVEKIDVRDGQDINIIIDMSKVPGI